MKDRFSQQQVKTILRLWYSLFFISLALVIWQLLVLNFDTMTVALVYALVFSLLAVATEALFYDGQRFSWNDFFDW